MRYISLKGARVPALGLGTYPLSGASGQKAIATALGIGYRHIDTAQMYGNEADVGAAIKASRIDRGEIFVTTKIDNANHAAAAVRRSTEASLRALKTDYVDLLLIHWPPRKGMLGETLDAMAKLRREGKARHLGISNFNRALVEEAVVHHGADLLCNQVEYHPFLSQRTVLAALRKQGMFLTAYCPVAHGEVARDPTIAAIAKRMGRTPAQITLNWLVGQESVAVIPKASSRAHLEENISIFDFELSATDRAAIDRIGSARGRIIDYPGWSPAWDKD